MSSASPGPKTHPAAAASMAEGKPRRIPSAVDSPPADPAAPAPPAANAAGTLDAKARGIASSVDSAPGDPAAPAARVAGTAEGKAGGIGSSVDHSALAAGAAEGGARQIGYGTAARVFYPPLACLDGGWSSARQRELGSHVMKIGRRAHSLHGVAIAQHIRRRWAAICRPPSVPRKEPLETALRAEWSRRGADAFYALPLDKVCNRWEGRAKDSDQVATYMAHAGKPWPTRFPHAAGNINGQKRYRVTAPPAKGIDRDGLVLAEHVVLGVLAMHRAGVTHNDLHAHNLLLDETAIPRWCDLDNAVIEREEDGDEVICDSLPNDARIFTALMDSGLHVFLHGRWLRDRPLHIARDWRWIHELFSMTWPVDPQSRDRRWANALAAIAHGDDQGGRLAWTLLRQAAIPPAP
jgi:hypothetical protein